MPVYEYLCSKCKCKFELMRPMSEAAKTGKCPNCGGSAQRVLSLFCKSAEGSSTSGASACSSCSSSSCSSCSV